MNPLAPVSEIMTKNVLTVSVKDSLLNVKHLFDNNNIHHVPVMEEGNLVGIVSRTDFFKGCLNICMEKSKDENELYDKVSVGKIMTRKIATVAPTERIDVAALIFHENRFHALPVLENNQLVGIVTTHDVIEYAYRLTQVAWQ